MSDAGEARTTLKSPQAEGQAAFTRLWARLEAYEFDKPDDLIPFTAKLAAECGWSRDKARRVAFEYKRFVAIALSSGHGACPSRAVDEAWHLHLLDTRRYWGEFCSEVLQRKFHHEPSRGGIAEDLRFDRLYRQTLANYRQFFGEEPPAEIWPDPDAPGLAVSASSGRQALMARLRALLKRAVKPLAFLALLPALPGCAAIYNSSSPGALQGPGFLALYVVLLAGAFVLSRALQDRVNGPAMPGDAGVLLGPYHFAYLAGGANRVLETALTQLYLDGTIAMHSDEAVLLRPVPQRAPAVERLIGDKLAEGPLRIGHTSIDIAVEPIRRDLLAAGLVPGPDELARTQEIPFLLFGPLLLLALLRFFFGIANERPIALLAFCLVATPFLIAIAAMRQPPRTPAGGTLLRQAEGRLQARGKPAANSPRLTEWVALHGHAGLAGLGLTAFSLFLANQPASAAKAGGGGSCGGGCGGGGGGGCGGGGCGG